jgi:predicted RNase H-like nuclease (RuvC/YqgF family)
LKQAGQVVEEYIRDMVYRLDQKSATSLVKTLYHHIDTQQKQIRFMATSIKRKKQKIEELEGVVARQANEIQYWRERFATLQDRYPDG